MFCLVLHRLIFSPRDLFLGVSLAFAGSQGEALFLKRGC
jgi:hypothetical protein